MTITTFANDRDQGSLANGEHLTSALDFYTLNTSVALSTDDFSALDSGEDLIRIGEIIGIQAQPVVTGLHVITGVADSTVYGLASGITTVYQLKFMIEHTNAWNNADVSGSVPGTLAYALQNETTLCPLPFSGATLTMGSNAALFFSAIL